MSKLGKILLEYGQDLSILKASLFHRNCKRMLEYFGDREIDKQVIINLRENPYTYDPILENLQTHDYEALGRSLQKTFPEHYSKIEPFSFTSNPDSEKKEYCRIELRGTKEEPLAQVMEVLPEDRKFLHLLQFYSYSISEVQPWGAIGVEPIYPTSGKDYIDSVCHGVVYHVSSFTDTVDILRQGLKCRTSSREKGGKYRDFPERIYVFALNGRKDKILDQIRILAKDSLYYPSGTYSVFKCKVIGGNFYKDTSMGEETAYFTYNTIPTECIKKIGDIRL